MKELIRLLTTWLSFAVCLSIASGFTALLSVLLLVRRLLCYSVIYSCFCSQISPLLYYLFLLLFTDFSVTLLSVRAMSWPCSALLLHNDKGRPVLRSHLRFCRTFGLLLGVFSLHSNRGADNYTVDSRHFSDPADTLIQLILSRPVT